MKTIHVVAAIIEKDELVLATQRGHGEFKGRWEFPGGKMEAGETPEQALIREIREELDIEILIEQYLCTVDHDYPTFHLTMHCFICSLVKGELSLREHEAAKWLDQNQLWSVEWLPADVDVEKKKKKRKEYRYSNL